jgi:hypothetical protein
MGVMQRKKQRPVNGSLVPFSELKNEFDKAVKIIEENKLGQYLESDPNCRIIPDFPYAL